MLGKNYQGDKMKLLLWDEMVFVDIGKGFMIYVATEAEVKAATLPQLNEMIVEAIIYSEYRSIEVSPKVVH